MINLFQIIKKKLIILINSLLLNAHPLIMIFKFLTQLFWTRRWSFLPLLLKTMISLKLSEIFSKVHGFDDISIRMVELCDDSLLQLLSIIFQKCLNSGVFPDSWKKSNIVSIYKKNNKQLINNYRPVSLLPICSKIFE